MKKTVFRTVFNFTWWFSDRWPNRMLPWPMRVVLKPIYEWSKGK